VVEVTNEVSSDLITWLDNLNTRGLSYQHINGAVGMKSKGWISEVRGGWKKSLFFN
jgi:hypothetical protein